MKREYTKKGNVVVINEGYSFTINDYNEKKGYSYILINDKIELNTFYSFGGHLKLTRDKSYDKLPKYVTSFISDFLNTYKFIQYIQKTTNN